MTLKIYKSDSNKSEEHSFCSTQVNLSKENTKKVVAWIKKNIPESEWYLKENETGIELEPHCTVLFGIKNENDYSKIKKVLKENNLTFLSSKLEHLSVFKQDDYDVLFVSVDDENRDFKKANKLIRDTVDYKSDFPNYKPHMTLCYMKKGTADKYKGMQPFENMILSGNVLFSNKKRGKIVLKSL